MILGADRKTTFWKVIFPEILPSLISGFTLAFARCIGEYGSVVFIAGNTPYETEIAPLLIMSELQEFDYPAVTSIALVMLTIAFVILSINAVIQSMVSRRVSGALKWILLVICFVFLAVFLLLPLSYIIATALRSGFETYVNAIIDEYAIKAAILTLGA